MERSTQPETTTDADELQRMLGLWAAAAAQMTKGLPVGPVETAPLVPPVDTGEAMGLPASPEHRRPPLTERLHGHGPLHRLTASVQLPNHSREYRPAPPSLLERSAPVGPPTASRIERRRRQASGRPNGSVSRHVRRNASAR